MKQRKLQSLGQGKPQLITKAVTHIQLIEVNPGKLAALDALAPILSVEWEIWNYVPAKLGRKSKLCF